MGNQVREKNSRMNSERAKKGGSNMAYAAGRKENLRPNFRFSDLRGRRRKKREGERRIRFGGKGKLISPAVSHIEKGGGGGGLFRCVVIPRRKG